MLCRACGGEMSVTEFCPSCNEGILWKCNSCEKENDRSVHSYHPESRGEWITTPAQASMVGILVSVASSLSLVAQI